MLISKDNFNTKDELLINNCNYTYFSLPKAAKALNFDLRRIPFSIKILIENLLRNEDGSIITKADIEKIVATYTNNDNGIAKDTLKQQEISFYPTRVLIQDFTGVPVAVDLAVMRDAMLDLNGDPSLINPLIPVDLVIDHSIQVDNYGNLQAFNNNIRNEMMRNHERYAFLRWAQKSFNNFRVVPPGTGICHQVNLEYLAKVVWGSETKGNKANLLYPDTLVGTDSHTTMINGLGVLGWGVGGIEAEAAMLGQPISMLLPKVVGFKLSGKLKNTATATDLVLNITEILRKKGVVGKFVEFFGNGLNYLSLADRATISNMAPEYGATCGIFPIDQETINYLKLTARKNDLIKIVKHYAKAQGLWYNEDESELVKYDEVLELNLEDVESSLAGPSRPQDKVLLKNAKENFSSNLEKINKNPANINKETSVTNQDYHLSNGKVVISAITSCTNTSNPAVMIGAGLLAQKAVALGLRSKPWVKTSLAPGSQVVTEYLKQAGLDKDLESLGFHLVGYGCTTCIGNSGPLLAEIEQSINDDQLVVVAVLSGNRNFEGRVHPLVRANYLASPILCVAYALSGTIDIDFDKEPIGYNSKNEEVFLRDIWPDNSEIQQILSKVVKPEIFKTKYKQVFLGNDSWQSIDCKSSLNYQWNNDSSYIQKPPYFDNLREKQENDNVGDGLKNIEEARILAVLGDSVTTDHISPAGSIAKNSPAAKYLANLSIQPQDFNSYGSRRGNHEVMKRGTFANTRIRNKMLEGTEGGYTKYLPTGEILSIYDAAELYQKNNIPLVIFAGKEYGTGSSRDWAAKGTKLLGVKAVIAESFERIHRSNLIGMGVIPLVSEVAIDELKIDGSELVSIIGIQTNMKPRAILRCLIKNPLTGHINEIKLTCCIDTELEIEYLIQGGILHYVLHQLSESKIK